MRVRARIIDHGRLVFVRFTGSQTAEMAINEMQRLRDDPRYRPGLPELVDLSGVTDDNINFHGMRRIAREANSECHTIGAEKRIALFAPHDGVYGTARMFTSLCEVEPGQALGEVFTDPAEALAWLGRSETRFEDVPGYALMPAD